MFTFNPNNVDRSGEILARGMMSMGRGLESAAGSIADAITKSRAQTDELKGYHQIAKALAADPANGIDPEALDKMDLGTVKGAIQAAEIRRQQAADRSAAIGNVAVAQALQEAAGAQLPQPAIRTPGTLAMDIAGGGVPGTSWGARPGMPAREALLQAIQRNPNMLLSPGGATLARTALLKAMETSPETMDNTPKVMTGPNGETVFFQPQTKNMPVLSPFTKSDARVREINAQAESNKDKNLLPEGTEFSTTENGFGIATLPDGTIKSLGRVPQDKKGRSSFFAQFMGGAAPAAASPPAAAAAAATGYQSADEVKAAFKAGKLERAAALKILQTQFGMQ